MFLWSAVLAVESDTGTSGFYAVLILYVDSLGQHQQADDGMVNLLAFAF